jgi:uncharacterized protein (TIGR02145 family)
MKTTKHFLSAAISIALAFTLSACDGGGGNDASYTCKLPNGNCIQTTSVSDCSQAGGSVVDVCEGQSGNQKGVVYGPSVSYGGETYQTVVIGTQTWLKRNLNVMHNEGNGDSWCYDEDDGYVLHGGDESSSCIKYGRFYNWAAAMNLPSSCNDTSCASQIKSKHRGICPLGFHIPNNAEWETLINYAGGWEIAGIKLKATSGWSWNEDKNKSGNGTDTYGFSALPGGNGASEYVGSRGYWWIASEDTEEDGYHRASILNIDYGYDSVVRSDGYDKGNMFSVRCVND